MDQKSLRKADFITSILVILFGLFVTVLSLQMPMEASYGGVQSHWYVAPALFPLSIGIGLMLMGALLCYIAVRDGGLRTLMDSIKDNTKKKIDEKQIRVLVIMAGIASFIYLFIPNIDFILSITTFLFFICSAFYMEDARVFVKITRYFLIESGVLLILIATGLTHVLRDIYPYTLDAMVILSIIGKYILVRRIVKTDRDLRKKLRTVLLVAVITPLVLCPIFRYPLLTPLPNEGILLDHMNLLYYAIKY